MFDVEDVLFESNGSVTVLSPGETSNSFLFVNNGELIEHSLTQCNRSRAWVLKAIKRNGFDGPADLFCMEWTPHKGFYFVSYAGDVKRGKDEIDAEEIDADNAQVVDNIYSFANYRTKKTEDEIISPWSFFFAQRVFMCA